MKARAPSAIDVPVVEQLPDLASRPLAIASIADYLLTSLLKHEAGLLHADFQTDGGRWRVRHWRTGEPPSEDDVAVTESVGVFRAILARFGATYLDGQLYGGFIERTLVHAGRVHFVAIYMANDQRRGYWIRIYSSQENAAQSELLTRSRR